MTTTSPFRFQFSLRTLNFLVLYVALVTIWFQTIRWWWSDESVTDWLHFLEERILFALASGLFLYTCLRIARGAPRFEICNLLVMSLLLAAFSSAYGFHLVMNFIRQGRTPIPMHQELVRSVVCGTTFPILICVPAFYFMTVRGGGALHWTTKWFLLAALVSWIDVLLLAWLIHAVMGWKDSA